MPKFAALLIPMLFLACRSPELAAPRPPAPAAVKEGKAQPSVPLALEIKLEPGVDQSEAFGAEVQTALLDELKDWGLKPKDAATSPGVALLQVKVKKYRPRPAMAPFAALGTPGIATTGLGLSLIAATSADEFAGLGILLVAAPLVGAGIALIAVGSAIGGRQAYLDRKRGYPMHQLKVEARLVLLVKGQVKEWKETYRGISIGAEARPMPPELSREPENVRKEMARALAREIRKDLANEFEWNEKPPTS